jgi:hypothetical protein
MSALAPALMHSAAIIVQSCLNFIDLGSWIPYFTGATAVQGGGFSELCISQFIRGKYDFTLLFISLTYK